MKPFRLIILFALLTSFFTLFGCLESNIQTPPFSTSQFVSRATDLNYANWKNSDYNNMVLVFKNDKISVADANDLNIALPDLSAYVKYKQASQDLNINGFDLLDVNNIIFNNGQEVQTGYIGGIGNEGSSTGMFLNYNQDSEKILFNTGGTYPLKLFSPADNTYTVEIDGDTSTDGSIYAPSGKICAGNTCITSLFYGDFGNVNPISTFSGGVRGSVITSSSGSNSAGGYFTNSSNAYTSGTNSIFGLYGTTTDSHTTGTSYQNNGFSFNSTFQPNSGTPSAARQYGGSLSSYMRATGSANPTATTVLGMLLQAGMYPTADVGTIGNLQGIQINLNTGDSDNSGGGLKITTARGILVNEPVNYGEIQNWRGLEMSNAYYNFGGNVVNDYSNIFLKGLNGGTVGGSSYNIYMEEMGRGEDGNWQIYSVGGDSYFGDGNIYLDGYMHADDYITNSKVADVDDGVSALSNLDNMSKWLVTDSKGKEVIDYDAHYAGVSYPISKVTGYETKLVDEVSCTPILGKDKKEQFNDLGARIEDCKTVKVSKQVPVTRVVVEEGLSMETRVAEMEKMIYELKIALCKTDPLHDFCK
jgi:hypothetical protein